MSPSFCRISLISTLIAFFAGPGINGPLSRKRCSKLDSEILNPFLIRDHPCESVVQKSFTVFWNLGGGELPAPSLALRAGFVRKPGQACEMEGGEMDVGFDLVFLGW